MPIYQTQNLQSTTIKHREEMMEKIFSRLCIKNNLFKFSFLQARVMENVKLKILLLLKLSDLSCEKFQFKVTQINLFKLMVK